MLNVYEKYNWFIRCLLKNNVFQRMENNESSYMKIVFNFYTKVVDETLKPCYIYIRR